ncbi:MAG: hypothetical protein R6X02_21875 [Enhygromyxa sp.]
MSLEHPPRPTRRGTLLAVLGFAIAGALLLVSSIPLWIRMLLVGLASGALLGQARKAKIAHGFEVDAEGVAELRAGQVFARVRWSELIAVSIVTTAEGSWSPDFYWVLHDVGGQQLVVPLDRAATTGLLTRLARLPGFDHQAVVRATSATSSVELSCWQGEPGDGAAAGGELE